MEYKSASVFLSERDRESYCKYQVAEKEWERQVVLDVLFTDNLSEEKYVY